MEYDYKAIVQVAAERKLIDLYKVFLRVLDELREEQQESLANFEEALEKCETPADVARLLPFLEVVSEAKKQQLRKRILDCANDLIRELKQ